MSIDLKSSHQNDYDSHNNDTSTVRHGGTTRNWNYIFCSTTTHSRIGTNRKLHGKLKKYC